MVSTAVADWYEPYYLSTCTGMWNAHDSSAGKNRSTISCVSQSAGYVFSLAELLNHDNSIQLLSATSNVILNTKAPLILLTLGIAFIGISFLGYLYGIFATRYNIVLADRPLFILRVAFFTSIAAPIMLSISTAKITASAAKMVGTVNAETGQPVYISMDAGFYAVMWVATAMSWVALGFVIFAAFRIAGMMKHQNANERTVGKPTDYDEEAQKNTVR